MSKIAQTTISRPYFDVVINYREGDVDDLAVIKEMFEENVYHLEGYKFVQDHAVVLDVGANIGTFTLLVLKLAQESNRPVTVYAVEPEKENLKLLKKNLADNPMLFDYGSTVEIIEAGISDFTGTASITSMSGSSRLVSGQMGLQTIDVVTYDDLIKSLGIEKIDFTKIDIEGSEVPLIKRASLVNLLKTHFYAIECDRFNESGDFISILTPFLHDFSFETWGVPGQGCNLYLENHHWHKR